MLRRAQRMDVEWYVPGHGFVDAAPALEEELDVFIQAVEEVIAHVRGLHERGVPVEQAVEEVDFGPLEEWSLRASQGPIAVRQVFRELDGDLDP